MVFLWYFGGLVPKCALNCASYLAVLLLFNYPQDLGFNRFGLFADAGFAEITSISDYLAKIAPCMVQVAMLFCFHQGYPGSVPFLHCTILQCTVVLSRCAQLGALPF